MVALVDTFDVNDTVPEVMDKVKLFAVSVCVESSASLN